MRVDPGEPPVLTSRPAELSADEVEATVAWLAKLPLRELRRRQDLVHQQQRMAYDQRNEQASINLRAMDHMLLAAVGRQCFPAGT
jgi:hypothetical protein